jgi:hypothetical protein
MKAPLLMFPLVLRRQRHPTAQRTMRRYCVVTKVSQLGDTFMLESSRITFLDHVVKKTGVHGRSSHQYQPTIADNPPGMVLSWP